MQTTKCKTLVPHWGSSPQPGSTYYLQKLSYDLLGIADYWDGSSAVYTFDERVGTKTADHTISYLFHYLISLGKVPSWVTRLHVFLDNAGQGLLILSSCMELVQNRVVHYFRVSFMTSGHSKFAADFLSLLSCITSQVCLMKIYYNSSVMWLWTVEELWEHGERKSGRNIPVYQESGSYMYMILWQLLY